MLNLCRISPITLSPLPPPAQQPGITLTNEHFLGRGGGVALTSRSNWRQRKRRFFLKKPVLLIGKPGVGELNFEFWLCAD